MKHYFRFKIVLFLVLSLVLVGIIGGSALIRAENQYELTVISDGNGQTTPNGSIMAGEGIYQKIEAYSPRYGYEFANWTKVDGDGTVEFTDANQRKTQVRVTGGNVKIQANFAELPKYTINFTTDGNGYIDPWGTDTAYEKWSQRIMATPISGYKFANWTQTDGEGTVVFDDANSATAYMDVTGGDATIRANFTELPPVTNVEFLDVTQASSINNTSKRITNSTSQSFTANYTGKLSRVELFIYYFSDVIIRNPISQTELKINIKDLSGHVVGSSQSVEVGPELAPHQIIIPFELNFRTWK